MTQDLRSFLNYFIISLLFLIMIVVGGLPVLTWVAHQDMSLWDLLNRFWAHYALDFVPLLIVTGKQ